MDLNEFKRLECDDVTLTLPTHTHRQMIYSCARAWARAPNGRIVKNTIFIAKPKSWVAHEMKAKRIQKKRQKTHQSNPAFDINQTAHLLSFWRLVCMFIYTSLGSLQAIVEQYNFFLFHSVFRYVIFATNANNDCQWHRTTKLSMCGGEILTHCQCAELGQSN